MDIQAAVAKHNRWKSSLILAISTGDDLDSASIGSSTCCAVGKWLHWDLADAFPANRSVQFCIEAHAEFHRKAGLLAEMINRDLIDDASRYLLPHAEVSKASVEVVKALNALSNLEMDGSRRALNKPGRLDGPVPRVRRSLRNGVS